MVKLKVNWDLLPLEGQSFLWNAGTAPIVPFLPIYACQLGFSSVVVGVVYTVLPFTGMLAKPIFGAIADCYRLQKILFLAFQIVTAISFFVIQFIAEIQTDHMAMLDHDAATYFNWCSDDIDSCAKARLVAQTSSSETILCKLECAANSSFVKEVCEVWNVPSYCGITSDNNMLHLDAEVPMIHTLQTESENSSCLHFRVHHVYMGASSHVPYCRKLSMAQCRVQCGHPAINEQNDATSRPTQGCPTSSAIQRLQSVSTTQSLMTTEKLYRVARS